MVIFTHYYKIGSTNTAAMSTAAEGVAVREAYFLRRSRLLDGGAERTRGSRRGRRGFIVR